MKEFSKSYRIRECSCYILFSLAMFSYEYIFSSNTQNAVLVPPVIDYSKVSYMFLSDQMYTPEIRVTTKYEVV